MSAPRDGRRGAGVFAALWAYPATAPEFGLGADGVAPALAAAAADGATGAMELPIGSKRR